MRYNPLFIYPNFTYNNPTQKQFERLLYAIEKECSLNILTRKGPRELDSRFNLYFTHGSYGAKLGGLLKYIFCDLAFLPDVLRWTTNPFLLRGGKRFIKELGEVDFLTTLSFPLSCHLVGYELKKKYGIPWIAIFYDPWIDNPYRHYKTKFFREYDAQQERLVAENGDAIIHTNDIISNVWRKRYGELVKDKIFTLPFCYTQDMVNSFKPSKRHSHDQIILSYIGQALGDRNLQDIIKVIKQLKDEGNKDINKLNIKILGHPYGPDVRLVEQYGLKDIFHFDGMLPPERLTAYYEESDIFIVVDAPAKANVFFPSKLMDYFYYQRPILGITPEISVTTELLKASGNIVICNGDLDKIKDFFLQVLKRGVDSIKFDKEYYQNFTPQNTSDKFLNIIQRIKKGNV